MRPSRVDGWIALYMIGIGAAVALGIVLGFARNAHAQPTGPASLPGTVEAENFDVGGEGVGYHDKDASNNGGAYRTSEGVDIALGDGGLVVSNFDTGEWLRFTVNVAQAGSYEIRLRAAAGEGDATYSFVVDDGAVATLTLTAPNTSSYSTFATSAPITVPLPAGQHQVRLTSLSKWADVNWWSATAVAGPGPTPSPIGNNGTATLTWIPPTQNTDGSPLTDLAGYSVYSGASSGVYTSSVHLAPAITTYILTGLAAGARYFAVTASNLLGDESAKSNEVSKVIPPEVALFPAAPTAVTAMPSVVPNVPGANVSTAFALTTLNKRSSVDVAQVPIGKPCIPPALFTYRNQTYMRFNPDDGLWWGTAKTANAAVACR